MAWSDRDIVSACLKLYPAPYSVTKWPEDSNRIGPEIDAYAEAPGVPPLAIEVTKIESFAEQRSDDERIKELVEALEPELGSIYPTGVDVLLETGAFKPGFNWAEARTALRDYLRDLRPRLTPGLSRHTIPGVPFDVLVSYEPELRTHFAVGRIAPSKTAKNEGLLRSMEKALKHKAGRLQEYRQEGARTVLIIESHDIALISHVHVYAAFVARKKLDAAHLDDVWLCRTANPHWLDEWYGFTGPQEILNCVNPPNLRLGPRHDEYWEAAIAKGLI